MKLRLRRGLPLVAIATMLEVSLCSLQTQTTLTVIMLQIDRLLEIETKCYLFHTLPTLGWTTREDVNKLANIHIAICLGYSVILSITTKSKEYLELSTEHTAVTHLVAHLGVTDIQK